jgi:hypothetical protein
MDLISDIPWRLSYELEVEQHLRDSYSDFMHVGGASDHERTNGITWRRGLVKGIFHQGQ